MARTTSPETVAKLRADLSMCKGANRVLKAQLRDTTRLLKQNEKALVKANKVIAKNQPQQMSAAAR